MALPSGMSACALCVEIATDGGGTTWNDNSDSVTMVTPGTQTRPTGETYVFGEDLALLTWGKKGPIEVTLRCVYTEGTGTTDMWNTCYTAHDTACGGNFAVRWAPVGCATTNQVFSTTVATSRLTSYTPPVGDASSPDALVFEAVVITNDMTWATYA
jgi:hypothetical protein